MSGFSKEQLAQLGSDLDAKHVRQRSQGGSSVSYIEGWHAMAECNRIFGFDRWEYRIERLEETNRDLVTVTYFDRREKCEKTKEQWRVGYLCTVTLVVDANGVTVRREGAAHGSGMAKPEALGDAIESAVKEAETDALKRALRSFGNKFGLALYDKDKSNVSAGADDVETEQQRAEREEAERISRADKFTETFTRRIRQRETVTDLDMLYETNKQRIDELPEAYAATCREQYNAAKARLTGVSAPQPPQRVNGGDHHA